MKIVCVDNFNRDYVSDKVIANNVSEYYGKEIVKFLNNKFGGKHSPYFFRMVEEEYELYTFNI